MLRMQKAAHWGHRGVGGDDAFKGEANIGRAAAVLHDALQFAQPSFEADAGKSRSQRLPAVLVPLGRQPTSEPSPHRAAPPPVPTICGLGCTNLSFHLGPARVDAQLKNKKAITTDMARAQVAALRALGAQRVALLTPYTDGPAQINTQVSAAAAAVSAAHAAVVGRWEDLSVPTVELAAHPGFPSRSQRVRPPSVPPRRCWRAPGSRWWRAQTWGCPRWP